MGEEQCPAGLSGVEPFSVPEILQIPVVIDDLERMNSSLQPMSPLFQGEFDSQQLTIPDVVVLLHRGELVGEIRSGMEFRRLSVMLG